MTPEVVSFETWWFEIYQWIDVLFPQVLLLEKKKSVLKKKKTSPAVIYPVNYRL